MKQNRSEKGITITDLSNQTSILALQGPRAPEIAKLVFGERGYPGRFRCGDIPDNPSGFRDGYKEQGIRARKVSRSSSQTRSRPTSGML